MHGRLKVKTTAEHEEEKRKEREKKKAIYSDAIKQLFNKRSLKEYNEATIQLSSQLLIATPDASVLWNIRRECLQNFQNHEQYQSMLHQELELTKLCLMKNPKSYGAWHHRYWVVTHFDLPPLDDELELCNEYLNKDERNFHCWDYRRSMVHMKKISPEAELNFTRTLIEKNFSNYSAWHYRSKLLPLIYPPSRNINYPICEEKLIMELETVVEAVFTDPSDQSPWFFLRWLLNREDAYGKPVYVMYKPSELVNCGECICSFSKPVSKPKVPSLSVNNETVTVSWNSIDGCEFCCVWRSSPFQFASFPVTLTVEFSDGTRTSLIVNNKIEFTTINADVFPNSSANLMKNTLDKIQDSCEALDNIDPGNKWVLLTLVDILSAIDILEYKVQIFIYLQQLEDIDPLRKNYYCDIRSKLTIEAFLEENKICTSSDLILSNVNLTCLYHSHLFIYFTYVDLSNNKLTSVTALVYLIACKKLILDNNKISNLISVYNLKDLIELHASYNNIESVDQIESISLMKNLKVCKLSGNPICHGQAIDGLKNMFLGKNIIL